MNLPYIQSELFRELVGMETLFKPGYKTEIKKCIDNVIHFSINSFTTHPLETTPRWWSVYRSVIDSHAIETAADITAVINRIWQAIPAECKKTDILK